MTEGTEGCFGAVYLTPGVKPEKLGGELHKLKFKFTPEPPESGLPEGAHAIVVNRKEERRMFAAAVRQRNIEDQVSLLRELCEGKELLGTFCGMKLIVNDWVPDNIYAVLNRKGDCIGVGRIREEG